MNIEFADTLPRSGSGRYAHYEHRRLDAPGWKIVDIRAASATRQDEWTLALNRWHADLCRLASQHTENWWLTPGSRLTAWYPADLKPLFFALAAADAAAENSDAPLFILGAPRDVREYIEEWSSGCCPKTLVRGPQPTAPVSTFRTVLSLAARIITRHFRPKPSLKDVETLAFSYTLRGDIFTVEDDHYFGAALDGAGQKEKTLWVYYLDFLSDLNPVSRYLAERGRRHAFYFDFLSLTDLAAIRRDAYAVVDALAPLEKELPTLLIGNRTCRAFARKFFKDHALRRPPILEMSALRAFKNILTLVRPRSVIYPYEEKGFERALLMACGQSAARPRTVAFAHAIYNNGHFYLRSARMPAPPPASERIAATSPETGRWLSELSGRGPDAYHAIGSPRFPKESALRPPSPTYPNPLRVLFLTGYPFEIDLLADMAERSPDLFDGCELLVRAYPYGWGRRQASGASRLKLLVENMRTGSESLDEQTDWCDVAIFASTSAGFHSMLRGRPTIHVDLHDHFTLDPLAGRDSDHTVVKCLDESDLADALSKYKSMGKDEYMDAARAHARFAQIFYAPLDLRRVARELQEA